MLKLSRIHRSFSNFLLTVLVSDMFEYLYILCTYTFAALVGHNCSHHASGLPERAPGASSFPHSLHFRRRKDAQAARINKYQTHRDMQRCTGQFCNENTPSNGDTLHSLHHETRRSTRHAEPHSKSEQTQTVKSDYQENNKTIGISRTRQPRRGHNHDDPENLTLVNERRQDRGVHQPAGRAQRPTLGQSHDQ